MHLKSKRWNIIDATSIIGEFSQSFGCEVTLTRSELLTVDKLFELVEEAVDEDILIESAALGEELFRAEGVLIQYEARFSYPKRTNINYFLEIADDSREIYVVSFEVIE